MAFSKEQQFFDAARAGDLSVVKKLAADTTLNINWQELLHCVDSSPLLS